LAGLSLVAVLWHWQFTINRTPMLLPATLVALGLWPWIEGAKRVAVTFGSKHGDFAGIWLEAKEQLRGLIPEKRQVLAALEPGTGEVLFSIRPRHWLAHRLGLGVMLVCAGKGCG